MFKTKALAGAVIATIAMPALAQQGSIEEVVVTATKRSGSSVQDIPTNISAISSDRLERAGIADFEDIARISGITTIDNGPGNNTFIIRGIQADGGPIVGVYYDEILGTGAAPTGNNGGQPDIRVVDIEQVEIVRGPQGTLYGAGSIGGIVKYVLKKPVMDELSASIITDIATVSQGGGVNYTADGILNIPLIEDKLAVRLVGGIQRDDGIVDRPTLGLTDTDEQEIDSYRAIIQWNATDNLTLTGTYINQERVQEDSSAFAEFCNSAVNFCFGNDFDNRGTDTRANANAFLNPTVDDMELYSFVGTYETDYGTLTASYSQFDRILDPIDDTSDFTGGALATLRNTIDNEQTNAEIRFASTLDGPVNFVVGASYIDRDTVFTGFAGGPIPDSARAAPGIFQLPIAGFDATFDRTYESKALFGEVTYDFTDQWSLIVGSRVFELEATSQETRRAAALLGLSTGVQPIEQDEFDDAIFKVSLAYNVTEDVLVYATWAEGFREGGANPIRVAALLPTYQPDTVTNYELGWKTTLLDGQLTFNGALFRLDWDDLQVALNTGPVSSFVNGDTAQVDGIEMELFYSPVSVPGLSVRFGMNYLDPRYTSDLPGITQTGPTILTSLLVPEGNATSGRAGDLIQQATKFTASGSVSYDFAMLGRDAFTSLDWSYTGKAFTEFRRDDPEDFRVGDYHLINARVGLIEDNWTATVYVNNLFDTKGVTDRDTRTGFANPSLADTVRLVYPRTLGVRFTYDF